MKPFLSIGFIVSISLYVITHFIEFWSNSQLILNIFSFSGLMALIFALGITKIRLVIMPVVFSLLSLFLTLFHFDYFDSFIIVWEGVRQMRSLIVMLLLVPVVSWVFKQEFYIEEFMAFLSRYLSNSVRFNTGIMLITQLISYFLLVGAIPQMFNLVSTFFKNNTSHILDIYKSTIILRAFSLGTLWVVSIPSLAFAIESTGASLGITIIQGFFISALGIGLSQIFWYVQHKKYDLNITIEIQREIWPTQNSKNESSLRLILEFVFLFISLLGSILIINLYLPWGLLTVIPLVIMAWTFLYFLIKKKMNVLLNQLKNYFVHDLSNKTQELSIFLSAGIFIGTIGALGFGEMLFSKLYSLTEGIPFFNFLWFLPIAVLILGCIGISPPTAMILIGGILVNISLPYPPELVVLSLTVGSVIAFFMSPLTAPVIILGNTNGCNGWSNSFKYNWIYASIFYLVAQAYIQIAFLWHWFL